MGSEKIQDKGDGGVSPHEADPGSDYIKSLLVDKAVVPTRKILAEHRAKKHSSDIGNKNPVPEIARPKAAPAKSSGKQANKVITKSKSFTKKQQDWTT